MLQQARELVRELMILAKPPLESMENEAEEVLGRSQRFRPPVNYLERLDFTDFESSPDPSSSTPPHRNRSFSSSQPEPERTSRTSKLSQHDLYLPSSYSNADDVLTVIRQSATSQGWTPMKSRTPLTFECSKGSTKIHIPRRDRMGWCECPWKVNLMERGKEYQAFLIEDHNHECEEVGEGDGDGRESEMEEEVPMDQFIDDSEFVPNNDDEASYGQRSQSTQSVFEDEAYTPRDDNFYQSESPEAASFRIQIRSYSLINSSYVHYPSGRDNFSIEFKLEPLEEGECREDERYAATFCKEKDGEVEELFSFQLSDLKKLRYTESECAERVPFVVEFDISSPSACSTVNKKLSGALPTSRNAWDSQHFSSDFIVRAFVLPNNSPEDLDQVRRVLRGWGANFQAEKAELNDAEAQAKFEEYTQRTSLLPLQEQPTPEPPFIPELGKGKRRQEDEGDTTQDASPFKRLRSATSSAESNGTPLSHIRHATSLSPSPPTPMERLSTELVGLSSSLPDGVPLDLHHAQKLASFLFDILHFDSLNTIINFFHQLDTQHSIQAILQYITAKSKLPKFLENLFLLYLPVIGNELAEDSESLLSGSVDDNLRNLALRLTKVGHAIGLKDLQPSLAVEVAKLLIDANLSDCEEISLLSQFLEVEEVLRRLGDPEGYMEIILRLYLPAIEPDEKPDAVLEEEVHQATVAHFSKLFLDLPQSSNLKPLPPRFAKDLATIFAVGLEFEQWKDVVRYAQFLQKDLFRSPVMGEMKGYKRILLSLYLPSLMEAELLEEE